MLVFNHPGLEFFNLGRNMLRMPAPITVTFHESQFPDRVMTDLRDSLRARQMNHKFLYDSYRQTQKWLAIHQAYAPSRNDPECQAAYRTACEAFAARLTASRVHVLGVGCGGGQKDSQLLRLLQGQGRSVHYTPVDVSAAMVMVASQTVSGALNSSQASEGLICDLQTIENLAEPLAPFTPEGAARGVTFFGTFHNFEPQSILPKLSSLLRSGDYLLFSTNLAPGHDYAAGVRQVLPQYNNTLTSEWLLTVLLDLGVERGDGTVVWRVEPGPGGGEWLRIAAYFRFSRSRLLVVGGEKFDFRMGDTIRLFFSYRYTPEQIVRLLAERDLTVEFQAVPASREEGVFLVKKSA